MKNHASVLFLAAAIFLLSSCKKEEAPIPENNTTSISVNDFYPLSPGSYWVYSKSYYDSSGTLISQMPEHDSVIVEKDTIINNLTYHKIKEYNFIGMNNVLIKFYRDSADCIVDDQGHIVFSIKNPGLVYRHIIEPDTIAYVDYVFNTTSDTVTVTCGTFICNDYRGDVFRKSDNYSIAYPLHKYCSKGKGVIRKNEMFLNSLYTIQFDLISYHIE